VSFEERFRKNSIEQDHSETMAEFGIDKEKAVEFQWRIARALWMGIQIGAVGSIIVLIMVLGAWALYRGVFH